MDINSANHLIEAKRIADYVFRGRHTIALYNDFKKIGLNVAGTMNFPSIEFRFSHEDTVILPKQQAIGLIFGLLREGFKRV